MKKSKASALALTVEHWTAITECVGLTPMVAKKAGYHEIAYRDQPFEPDKSSSCFLCDYDSHMRETCADCPMNSHPDWQVCGHVDSPYKKWLSEALVLEKRAASEKTSVLNVYARDGSKLNGLSLSLLGMFKEQLSLLVLREIKNDS